MTDGVAPPAEQANLYRHYADGRKLDIELGIIHGAKGETHQATLLMETASNRRFAVAEAIPFLLGAGNADLLKKLHVHRQLKLVFVGMTRPREMLCLAVKKEHVAEHLDDLRQHGWRVLDITIDQMLKKRESVPIML